MIRRLIILGASGDLTRRYLMPALAQALSDGYLPEELEVVGISRDEWDTDRFRDHIAGGLSEFAADLDSHAHDSLLSRLEYRRGDVSRPEDISVLNTSSEPAVIYLALPPVVFGPAIEALKAVGVADGCRIIVEKPFGEDLDSARRLNQILHTAFPEEAVFRIDHFLGKQTVQNILGLRFANRFFESIWNCQHVERVEIAWDETLALEGRAGYYDSAGALRDMIQNHLLQLLALVAMEPPLRLSERDLRDRKLDVLRAVRRPSAEEAKRFTVRARYGRGRVGDRHVPAYSEEDGVDPERGTETFAQVTLLIDNWRWAGTPFVLRTGKALGREREEIAIHFKPVPHLVFEEEPAANVLRIEVDPDRLALSVNINGPGNILNLQCIELDQTLARQDLSAYARLLLDALEGDPTLSIRDDEAEECWRIVEPIMAVWRGGSVPLLEYPAGSAGPPPAV